MAFDTVRVKKVRGDEEDSFLDYDGKATLFDDEPDEDPEEAEEAGGDPEEDLEDDI